eukprot:11022057-Alexandrium_andersonii.AAC.1
MLVPVRGPVSLWRSALMRFITNQSWRASVMPFPWIMMLIHFELSMGVRVEAQPNVVASIVRMQSTKQ